MATVAESDKVQSTHAALRSAAVIILAGLIWGAIMMFVFGSWMRAKYDITAIGQRMVGNGLLFAGIIAVGLAIWQGFTLWFKKETPDQKAATLEQQKQIFSYVFIAAGFAMIALAFYVGVGRKVAGGNIGFLLDNFAESFGTLLFGLIAICGGYALQRPAGDQGITVQFLVEKVQLLKLSQVVVAAAAIVGMVVIVNRNWENNAYTTYLPELALLLAMSMLSVACFLHLNSSVMNESGVRRFVLIFGGVTGMAIFLWSVWRTIMWRDDIFLGGATAWSSENSYRFWLCAYVLFFSLILMFVSFNLAKADVREDITLRRIMYGYDTVVQALLLVGILYVFNVVFYALVPFTFDWTKSRGIYALAPSTKRIVEGLKNETNFVVMIPQNSPVFKDLKVLLDNARALNSKLEVTYISPDTDRDKYAKLSKRFKKLLPDPKGPVQVGRGVLLVNGKMPETDEHNVKYWFVPERKLYDFDRTPDGKTQYTFKAEDEIFKEFKFLLQDRAKRKVYFLQGNGEPSITKAGARERPDYRDAFRNVAMRFVVDNLKRDNYDVAGLSFELEEKGAKAEDMVYAKAEGVDKHKVVPEDCHTLIVAGVSKPLSNDVVEALDRYMSRGGKIGSRMMVFLDVISETNYSKLKETGLEPMLKRFGVEVTNDFVLRVIQNKDDDPGFLLASGASESSNPLAAEFSRSLLFLQKSARVVKPAPGGGRFKAETILELNKGLSPTVNESDAKVLADPQKYMWNLFDKDRRKLLQMLNAEPVPVAVAVTEEGRGDAKEADKPRMVVVGDTEFLTDFEMLTSRSKAENYDFFLSSLEWMAERESIGGNPKRDTSFRLPAAAMNSLGRMILLPGWLMLLTLITLGCCVWVVRRR